MKKILFAVVTMVTIGLSSQSASAADVYEINCKARRAVTLNGSTRCPRANVDKCIITVTVNDNGTIGINVGGKMVQNDPTYGSTAQQIAESVAAILEAEGAVQEMP